MTKPTHPQTRLRSHKRTIAAHEAKKQNARLEARITQVVQSNLDSGRFQRVNSGRSKHRPLTIAQYVDRVTDCVAAESARIQALAENDAAEWKRLFDFLFHRARRLVRRFRSGTEDNAAASDFAQQACSIIFEERYPFDVAFEAWATTILNHLILAHFTRSPDALDPPVAPESLDAPRLAADGSTHPLAEVIPNPNSLVPFEKVEMEQALLDAVHRLRSQTQQRVIVATFLEGLDVAQISKELGKSRGAIYTLRNRALSNLREILGESGAQEFGIRFHQIE